MRMRLVFIAVLLMTGLVVQSQPDTSSILRKTWLPDHVKLHFAGEIGFLSLGLGYELFQKKNGEVDLFGGFLPEEIGGDNVATIALKFHYMPWKKEVFKKAYQLEPLTIGAIAYHAFGRDLNKARDRDIYPTNYYWWTVSTRFGPFFGSRLTKELGKHSFIKSLTFYYEIGTNDLYMYSWAANRSTVPLHKIWNSSFGLKAVF